MLFVNSEEDLKRPNIPIVNPMEIFYMVDNNLTLEKDLVFTVKLEQVPREVEVVASKKVELKKSPPQKLIASPYSFRGSGQVPHNDKDTGRIPYCNEHGLMEAYQEYLDEKNHWE